jgi:hypothetical protein
MGVENCSAVVLCVVYAKEYLMPVNKNETEVLICNYVV